MAPMSDEIENGILDLKYILYKNWFNTLITI